MDGHPAGDVTTAGTFTDRLPVTSVFKDFAITGTVTPRRTVVDINKCDVCHGVLSLHGNNRNNEPGVCVICHNPNATDLEPAHRRGRSRGEQSIDFKTMIHAIHAGESDKGGFRTTGITIYGYGGTPEQFQWRGVPRKTERLLDLPCGHFLPVDRYLGGADGQRHPRDHHQHRCLGEQPDR